MNLRALGVTFLLLSSAAAFAGPTLYAIGPDSTQSGPFGFYSVSTTGPAAWQFDLGGGSLGINGGLAYDTANDLLYAVANDNLGNSSLVSFSATGGGFTTIGGLGQGFVSGLAYNSADGFLYGISTDPFGQSALDRISLAGVITPVDTLGTGFYGGLTFNSADGLLYAFSGEFGVQREFRSIDPATAATALLFTLGDGSASFNGGVAYNSQANLFYAISNDWSGGSTLQSFTLAGGAGSLTPVTGIGSGFLNVGLVSAEPVPEPGTLLSMACSLAAILLSRFRSRL